jgi:predicted nucleic acid-binding protein
MDKIKVIFSALENYGFINVDLNNTFADKAIMISFKNNISFYDAVYVALALNMNADLYTADEKLIKLAHNLHVRHIKDFK